MQEKFYYFQQKLNSLAKNTQNNIMKDNNKAKKPVFKIFIGSIVGFINGFFGGGAGMVLVPALTNLLGYEDKYAHASSLSVILPLSIVSAIVYCISIRESVNLYILSGLALGFITGGIMGTYILKKMSNKTLRIIFSVLIILCGIVQLAGKR